MAHWTGQSAVSAAWTSESTAPAFRVESHLEKAGPVGPGLQADGGSQGGGPGQSPPLLLIHQPKGPSVGLSGSGSGRMLFLNTLFCKVLRTMARTNAVEKLKESSLYCRRIIIFLLGETPLVNEA